MQEVALSDDLTQLTTEIKTYQNIGGQAIFEIGRRLKKVKEEDLAHGQYLKWLESVKIDETFARRAIIVANRFSKQGTLPDLGATALYLMATLPEEERNQPQQLDSGEVKKPDEMTVRELRETKQKLKQSEAANKTLDGLLSEKADTIKALNQQIKDKPQPEVVERTVTKEVKPTDYEDLKQKAETFDGLKKRNDYIEKAYQDLLEKRKDVDHDAAKMRDLEEQIKNLHGQLNEKQKHELAYKRTSEFIKKANQMLDQISPLIYAYDYEDLDEKGQAYTQLKRLVSRVNKWADDLNKVIGDQQIIEGDFTNG